MDDDVSFFRTPSVDRRVVLVSPVKLRRPMEFGDEEHSTVDTEDEASEVVPVGGMNG